MNMKSHLGSKKQSQRHATTALWMLAAPKDTMQSGWQYDVQTSRCMRLILTAKLWSSLIVWQSSTESEHRSQSQVNVMKLY
ncbi:hypothetical protein UNPF46_23945 [Bradyrhizobium sp. UNPF46]|nr:hypothetical protein UNPF46_23945 [Bradyrhizobium sp. UNPF46]